jgi:hypothetical protein
MLGEATNPMLQQAEQGIEAKVPANLKDGLDKVVHAGLTILYSPKLAQQRNERIAATTDPVKDVGEGAARMMSNLFQQSGKKMPMQLIVPAAMILGFEYLDLLGKAGKAEVTPDLIAKASQSIADSLLPLFNVTKEQLAGMMAKAQGGQPAAPTPAAPSAGIIGTAQAGA